MIKAGRLFRTTAPRAAQQRGFTLVELLVVITIIAILAGILTVAVAGAMKFIQGFTIGAELQQMNAALTQYYSKYGSYPPCMGGDLAGAQQMDRHLDTAFRNHRENALFFYDVVPNPTDAGVLPLVNGAETSNDDEYEDHLTRWPELEFATMENLDASETLPFFLGGAAQYSQLKNCGNALGLKVDPVRPLTGSSTGTAESFYTFKTENLVDLDGDGFPSWIPDQGEGTTPFVYFTKHVFLDPIAPANTDYPARMQYYCWPPQNVTGSNPGSYDDWIAGNPRPVGIPPAVDPGVEGGFNPGIVRPYIDGRIGQWYGEKTYQLISAGMDGRFGADGLYEGTPDPNAATNGNQLDVDDWVKAVEYKRLTDAGTANSWWEMDQQDQDNVANFTEGANFGDIGME